MSVADPYRQESVSALDRIASLEAELARLREGLATPQSRALAALRVEHLREDRDEWVARFQRRRGMTFFATAGGMIASLAAAVALVGACPTRARLLWLACGGAVTLLAFVGAMVQGVLRDRTRARVRLLERRIAEERLASGEPAIATPRVRVESDPFDTLTVDPLDVRVTMAERQRA